MSKKLYFIVLFSLPVWYLGLSPCMAQQDALYSQYMFNPFTINPAYAGSRKTFSTVLLYRNQWLGMDGAPKSQSLSIHTPIEGRQVGLGFNLINDQIGPTNNFGVFGTYAYHLPVLSGKFSMALRAGVYRYQLNGSILEYKNPDKFSDASITGRFVPSFDFGTYYYTNTFYIGAAATHLTQQKISFDEGNQMQTQLRRHFILTLGNAFIVNENIVLKPSAMLKYTDGAPVNLDLNFSVLARKVIWLGFSYRTSGNLVLITEFNFTSFLRAGYSYDLGLSKLSRFNNGSHEIFVGADFHLGKQVPAISPRLL